MLQTSSITSTAIFSPFVCLFVSFYLLVRDSFLVIALLLPATDERQNNDEHGGGVKDSVNGAARPWQHCYSSEINHFAKKKTLTETPNIRQLVI